MVWVIVVIVALIVIVAIALIVSYNRFVKQRNLIQESWRQIDVELHRRYDLIPNLVETVRAYAAHERHVFEEVARLRTQAVSAEGGSPEQRAQAETALSGALRQMMISVEAYPQLQSNQNFLNLQRELTDTEDRIAAGRRFYNANVGDYNTRIEAFPSNLIAGMFKFEKAGYFEVEDADVRSVPRVSFGTIGAVDGEQGPTPPIGPGPGQPSSGAVQPQMPSAGEQPAGLPPAGPGQYGPPPGQQPSGPPPGPQGPQDGQPPFTGGH
jgi:LemA protein